MSWPGSRTNITNNKINDKSSTIKSPPKKIAGDNDCKSIPSVTVQNFESNNNKNRSNQQSPKKKLII